jgi:hypothetical protein
MAKHVMAILESDETPSASTLEVCRKWLDGQGVTADAIRMWAGGLGFDPSSLPRFEDDGHEAASSGAQVDPFRNIAPFRK